MANYKSKFLQLHENIYSRYTHGAGFLAGDVVKFKKNTPKSEWFQERTQSVQQLVLAMMSGKEKLRIGVLKSEYPTSRDIGGNNFPAAMADIYVEISPANWRYPLTVPLNLLDRVEAANDTLGGDVPEHLKDKNRTQIKGGKKAKAAAKETKIDDNNRNLPNQNVKIPGGNKWDDSKVGGGNLSAMRESVDSLEDAYKEVIQESINPGSTKKEIRLTVVRLPKTGEWRVSYIENGRLNESLSYYTDDKEDALSECSSMEKKLHAENVTVESVVVDQYEQCDYEPVGNDQVGVAFRDTVHSSIHNDEIPVVVKANFTKNQAQVMNDFKAGWVLDGIEVTDERGQKVNLTRQDQDYLSSRSHDFINKYDETVELDGRVLDETMGNPRSYKVGEHTVTHKRTVTKGEDPTEMNTYTFDNGYQIIEFFGDFELKDPSGKRIKYVDKADQLNRTMRQLGLPLFDEIEDVIEQSLASDTGPDYDKLMGDMTP